MRLCAIDICHRNAAAAGRPILIYPEGTLMKVGTRGKYRADVYNLAADLGLPSSRSRPFSDVAGTAASP